MKELLAIARALSDESRVRALWALEGGELCVCQLIELLDLAPSTVSRHLAVLSQAGLVETRKDGRWVYYRQAGPDARARVRQAMDWLRQGLGRDSRLRDDAGRLRRIRKMSPNEVCARHKGRC